MQDILFDMQNDDIVAIYHEYVNMVYRISIAMLKNREDAEDATQTVFIKYMSSNTDFQSREHVKTWLITVTRNKCRDMLRHWWKRKRVDLDEAAAQIQPKDPSDYAIWSQVLSLHEKYKLPLYLYYYEGYKTEEIANILAVNHATIRTRLKTAKKKLKLMMKEEEPFE